MLDQDSRRIAIEIELSHKSRKRLEDTLDGYARSLTFSQVHYVVTSPALARYLERLYQQRCALYDGSLFSDQPSPPLRIIPLNGLPEDLADAIRHPDGPRRPKPRPPQPVTRDT